MRTEIRIFALLSVSLVGVAASGQATPDATGTSVVPILQGAALPVYPPIARAAHVTGKVTVRVTVKDGAVAKTEVLSKLDPAGRRFLETPTTENLKTWHFAANVNGEFRVTYSYAIAGAETDGLTNPKVEMLPSLDVSITARPVKPTVTYGAQGVPTASNALHESGHVAPPKQDEP